jgi:hypothetical protein
MAKKIITNPPQPAEFWHTKDGMTWCTIKSFHPGTKTVSYYLLGSRSDTPPHPVNWKSELLTIPVEDFQMSWVKSNLTFVAYIADRALWDSGNRGWLELMSTQPMLAKAMIAAMIYWRKVTLYEK